MRVDGVVDEHAHVRAVRAPRGRAVAVVRRDRSAPLTTTPSDEPVDDVAPARRAAPPASLRPRLVVATVAAIDRVVATSPTATPAHDGERRQPTITDDAR